MTFNPRLAASISLGIGGVILAGMGVYFIVLRPPILPEDARYIGASLALLEASVPRIMPWLARIFTVLGGQMIATGSLTIYVAVTSFRKPTKATFAVVAFSGLASMGMMVIINFLIDSDFKWTLLAFTLPWFVALLAPYLENAGSRPDADR